MAVPGLPTADSLLSSIAALRRTLAMEEAAFRATLFTTTSADGNVQATVNGMVEVQSVAIQPNVWPPAPPATARVFEPALADACRKALANANADTKPKASLEASADVLTGIPNATQPPPAAPNFASAEADFTALLRAQDPIIAARTFQGVVGMVTAVVNGALALVSLTLEDTLPPARDVLEVNVVLALNLALEKAKHLFEDGAKKQVGAVDSSAVTPQAACLWAQNSLELADRAQLERQDGRFAPAVSSGAAETNIGVEAQVGDLWSRGPVVLRERAHVNGSLRAKGAISRQNDTLVTGTITENGFLLQIPKLSFSVTFPSTNQGTVTVAPDQTRTLTPGAFGDVAVQSRATLFLSTGTYFVNNLTVEPQAKISCTSSAGQVVIQVKNGVTFRGSIIEKNGGRPKLFVGVFGTSPVSLGAPFTGTLVALDARVDFATVGAPGHSGAFYAKDIVVQPDNTIVHFPFSGPPAFVVT
jgi:DNA-binding protein YbaB